MPVSRIAARSARSACGGETGQVREHPRVQLREQFGQLGVDHVFGELGVPAGFQPVPSVLVAHRHDDLVEQRVREPGHLGERPGPMSAVSSWYLAFCRCADAQTPITEARPMGSVGALPLRVNLLIGTWIAMVCTLNARSPFTPPVAGVGIRCRFWKGRRTARSNTAPRST